MTIARNRLIRNTHPNLYFAVIVFGIWGVLSGLNIIFTNPVFPASVEVRYFFGAGFFIFGAMKLIGAHRPTIEIARAGMIGCMLLCTLFAALATIAFLNNELRTLYTAINFFFIGLVQLSAISEPTVNPLTMKKTRDVS